MIINVCKWFNNYNSPVLFMIDDFANVWVDVNSNGKIDISEDWGYAGYGENSSLRYLENQILRYYPKVKVTFFVPVGKRVGIIEDPKIKSISLPINSSGESKKFFKSVNDSKMYEIAYHGTTHGKAGKTPIDFIQEWETYKSLTEAIDVIETGKEIFKDVFGIYPTGGKYCGYASGDFGDESIDQTGFIWWCRYWNRGLNDNPKINFDVKFFGNNNIVDIPSTISGSLFNSLENNSTRTLSDLLRILLKPLLVMKKKKQLDYLIKNRLVLSIQEHISPARDDGKRQTPNIYDDIISIKKILEYLEGKNVWYCTGTELAKYVLNRKNVEIKVNSKYAFQFEYTKSKIFTDTKISLFVNIKAKSIKTPSGEIVVVNNGVANVPIMRGEYLIIM